MWSSGPADGPPNLAKGGLAYPVGPGGRVEPRASGRVWIAEYVTAEGPRTRKKLGPAWVKNSGRTTARAAVVWRAAEGSKPDATYLTPRDAEAALERLLAAERDKPRTRRPASGKTFGDACASWLHEVEYLTGVEETTLRNYKTVARKLKDEFGADVPVGRIAAPRIERYQLAMLTTPIARGKGKAPTPLARKTVRTRMIMLRVVFDHARAKGWTTADVRAHPGGDILLTGQPNRSEIACSAAAALPVRRWSARSRCARAASEAFPRAGHR